jgi:hypothetical protein
MSGAAEINQRVNENIGPAGAVADVALLTAWLNSLPKKTFPRAAVLVKRGVVESLDALESELIIAYLTHEPTEEQQTHAEALLLAVLGRDPKATAIGFATALPLPATALRAEPAATILERAVTVGEQAWAKWPEARRRREYLLLEFFDTVTTEASGNGRKERLAACLRALVAST